MLKNKHTMKRLDEFLKDMPKDKYEEHKIADEDSSKIDDFSNNIVV